MVIPLEYPIEILENIYEPTLNVKIHPCTPVGAPAGTPAHYHGGYEPVDSLITPTVTQGEHLGGT